MAPILDGTADVGSWQYDSHEPALIAGARWGYWSALFTAIGLVIVVVAL